MVSLHPQLSFPHVPVSSILFCPSMFSHSVLLHISLGLPFLQVPSDFYSTILQGNNIEIKSNNQDTKIMHFLDSLRIYKRIFLIHDQKQMVIISHRMEDTIKSLTSLYNCTGQQRITQYSTVNQGDGYVCPSSLTRTFRNGRNERNDGIWLNTEC
jgi:hypothetical protein